jgi:hypothetical protein
VDDNGAPFEKKRSAHCPWSCQRMSVHGETEFLSLDADATAYAPTSIT